MTPVGSSAGTGDGFIPTRLTRRSPLLGLGRVPAYGTCRYPGDGEARPWRNGRKGVDWFPVSRLLTEGSADSSVCQDFFNQITFELDDSCWVGSSGHITTIRARGGHGGAN